MFDLPDVLGLSASQERIISNYDSLDSSNHYKGETSNMNGVGDMPPSMSQSLTGDMPACMTQSMQVTPSPSMSDRPPDIMTTSTNSLNFKTGKKSVPNRNQTSQIWFAFDDADSPESRAEISAKEKEREEKVRRIREQQEEERKRKLEELKQHALQAQKFREQQENERRRHIDELRSKDMDRRQQVEERRKEIERSELERREAILAKNRDRETRLETQRKNSRGNIEFAFGSSAPRLIEPRIDSSSGYWGSRSVSGAGMFERSQRSAERELGGGDFKPKRTASAQGLDRSTEEGWGTAFQWSADSPPKPNDLRPLPRSKTQSAIVRRSTKSTPVSPQRESHPLHWFVRDIDIGDIPLDTRSESGARRREKEPPHYMLPLQRTRSHHDCSFVPGTPFLAGDENG